MRKARSIREARGLSLGEVYKATDIDDSHLSKWERGLVELSVANVQKLAILYGCRMDELLDIAEPEPASTRAEG